MSHFERIKLGVPADSWVLMTRGNLMNRFGAAGKSQDQGYECRVYRARNTHRRMIKAQKWALGRPASGRHRAAITQDPRCSELPWS